MTREMKDNVTVVSAVAMLLFGTTLTSIAFFLPPPGEIHDSVLWVLGQCFLYAGGALGIASYARTVAHHEVDERFNEYNRHHHGHGKSNAAEDDYPSWEKPLIDEENGEN